MMTGKQLIQKLKESGCQNERRLAVGRAVLETNPRATGLEVLNAYRALSLDLPENLTRFVKLSPAEQQICTEKHNWIENTLKKLEQIFEDGTYVPEKMLTPVRIPIEDLPDDLDEIKASRESAKPVEPNKVTGPDDEAAHLHSKAPGVSAPDVTSTMVSPGVSKPRK